MSQKLVVVTGATGLQGGAVIRALVANGAYRTRAITRQLTSPAAKQLVEQGVDVVQATLDDKDSLIKAFEGAYAVYGCTPFGDATEEQQGKNIVDACKVNQVPLLLWSALPDAAKTSGGKYTNITHYDRKARVTEYINDNHQPAVTIYLSNFSDNLLQYYWIRRSEDGSYTVAIPLSPDVSVAYTWVDGDLGEAILAIIKNWEIPEIRAELQGNQPLHVCSYRITASQMADSISKITGKPTHLEASRSTGSGELDEMLQYQDDGLLYPDAEIPPPILTKLGVAFHTFEDFARAVVTPSVD
ncbi:NAD(P)-binding protein [Calocera viscosa TUFC12733]|uniref:NAD(P)-binding protein n=1 Tax=Calocera viscosa (strain TUFC12733) TaxID=1330018 RepID=A0A167LK49_CALVF|nr:NAD(P)-binding protein [Calocera viscosa TUFC12733]